MSASQRFLRGFRAFRCRIDAFVRRRVRRVCKGVNLILRVVWIVPGLRISCRCYRNDVPCIVVGIVVFDFDDAVGLRCRLNRPLRRRGVRVIENGFVDLYVPYLYNNVTNFFAVYRVRDLETAYALVLFIFIEVFDICLGPVFPYRTVGVLKLCLVEDIAFVTVYR